MRHFFAFFTILSALSCASVQPRAPLSFSKVLAISYGETKSAQLEQLFGKPDKVLVLDPETLVWCYEENESSIGKTERLNISIDKATDRVGGAIWIPRLDERNKERVMSYFKNAHFDKEFVGLEGGHHFSRDEIYTDKEKGISFYLNTVYNTVQHIGFSVPAPAARKLSNQADHSI
jgi:hypothetical protein